MTKRTICLLVLLVLTATIPKSTNAQESVSIKIKGYVYGPDGEPLQNASILLWGFYLEGETSSNREGQYELSATTTETSCQLYVIWDDPKTPNYDLLPTQKQISTNQDVEITANFTLQSAATIHILGQLKPMESNAKITKFALEVIDPVEKSVQKIGDYRLVYGTGMNIQSYFLGLDSRTLIVPANVSISVKISSSYQHERYPPSRYRSYRWRIRSSPIETFNAFIVGEIGGYTLSQGELLEIDIRKYSLMADLDRIMPLISEAESELAYMESLGFYITAERFYINEAKDFLLNFHEDLENNDYESAYVDIKQAYLKLLSVNGTLDTLLYEANISLEILLVFTAIASFIIGGLLIDKRLYNIIFSISSYFVMIVFLRLVFPGSILIDQNSYLMKGTFAILFVIIFFHVLPMVFGDTFGRRGISSLGSLVVIASMGKRILRRRKLRSFFTFSTILVLTMSFVALTSLSTSYGLIFNRDGIENPDIEGLMVRMPIYHPSSEFEEGLFSPIIAQTIEWVWENEGVLKVAELAENTPSLRPYGRIEEWPIFGIIGVNPELDPIIPFIDDSIILGDSLRGEKTCLLHINLRSNADLEIGDQIQIGGITMIISGFFKDLGKITDIDGVTIIPDYQVMVNGDPPTIEVRTCNEDSVIITTLDTALSINKVLVSRIDIELEPNTDLRTIGKSMALSREYRVWISENGKAFITYMGNQTSGKGFPILIPWMIVILNVLVTMINSMLERQKEIDILSSIGLNPIHISGIFIAEASILGITGGSIGYLLGLGVYPFMITLNLTPVVSQKVSAIWLLASLGVAIASVIFGSLLSLGWSVKLTPSLTMRWKLNDIDNEFRDHWSTKLPVRLSKEDIKEFFEFTHNYLEKYNEISSVPRITSLKISFEYEKSKLSFVYDGRDTVTGATWTTNEVKLVYNDDGFYIPVMNSKGDREAASRVGTFIRKIIIRWSNEAD